MTAERSGIQGKKNVVYVEYFDLRNSQYPNRVRTETVNCRKYVEYPRVRRVPRLPT